MILISKSSNHYLMKKFILFSLFLNCLFSCPAYSQENGQLKTAQEIKDFLCHKWKVAVCNLNGKKMIMTPEMGETYVLFKSDGTITETDQGKDSQGTWAYTHKTKTLTTNDKDGIQNHTIVRINNTSFVYKDSIVGMNTIWTLKRVD